MKKKIAFSVSIVLMVLLFQSFYPGPETDARLSQLLAKANTVNLQYPQENVYLHIDRPSYWANDDIWFKAYLKNSPLETCNLYVELLNAKGTVIQKKICWAQNGLSYGDFHLPDTTYTGVYQIRAYTNWMRNFDESGFFRKNIIIWNLRDKKEEPKAISLKERKVDLQFFPEGGTFINNISTRVAFKAADQNGKGLDVKGRIIDELGNEVTSFKSGFKGMGSFTMTPLPGKRYRAEVMVANQLSMEAELPVAQAEGAALAIEKMGNDLLSIKISEQTVSTNNASAYTIVGRAGGEVFYKREVVLENGVFNLELKKDILPAGIIQFTLFDNNLVPRCERLVFVNTPEVVNIGIRPEEGEYSRRGKVNMDIEAFDAKDNPCSANLSVSAYYPETQLKMEEYPNHILSQFMLGSELKGIIEEPGYYFKDDSISTQTALDNLMLTHGWRHFEWKEIKEDKTPIIEYPAEECIKLRGSVKNFYTHKPLQNSTVTMMTVNSLLSVKDQKTDSLGKFIFTDLYFNDTLEVTLQAENAKGRKNTMIEVDKKSSVSPKANYLPVEYQYRKDHLQQATTFINEENMNLSNRKWRLSDTILLNELYVRGRKQIKEDGHVRMYKEADFVLNMKNHEDDVYSNIYDAIDGLIPGVRYEALTNTFMARGIPLLIYLDGIRVNDPNLLNTFSSHLFDKVEYVKMGNLAGVNYEGGILYFYQKRGGKFVNSNTMSMGMNGTIIIGYSVIRQFYSPQYDPDIIPETRNDFRNTLYWNPVVQTDSTGMANVSYFNSDQTGEVEVVVEGVTSDGKLCRGSCKYNVLEK